MKTGMKECIFVSNGLITEGSHSNIFFVIDGHSYTHPESNIYFRELQGKIF